VCETTSGGTPLKSKEEYYQNGIIPWLRSGEVAQGFIEKSELFITPEGLKNSSAKLLPVNTVLIAMYGATAGQVGLLKFESTTNQAVCGILPCDKFIPEFLFQALKDQKDIMVGLAGGGAQPNISQAIIRNLEVPLPPLQIQKQIVVKIESERALVESSKKLVEIYEQKTKGVLSKLWSE
jgi:restriction endonuclease S subunit